MLIEKSQIIEQVSAKICEIKRIAVFGSGYVGLPTAALFANSGFSVTAVDINPKIVNKINNGISTFEEPGLQELITNNVRMGRLNASLSSEVNFNDINAAIVTVQTPINNKNEPDLSFLLTVVNSIAQNLRNNMLVVICSTVPPGTLRDIIKPILESNGLIADKDFYLAYVPERISPGRAIVEFIESPRLVGGIGQESTRLASTLFKNVCKKIIETDCTTAEISKVAENTFRDINIAFANQLALICEQKGADIKNVIRHANTHPRVNIHTSGPGVGGPCLTKDPYLLIFKNKLACNLVSTARAINDCMPKHVIELTLKAFKENDKKIKNSKIAVLGTSYKGNVDDPRYSPSEKIIKELLRLKALIVAYDPFCSETFGAKKADCIDDAITGADCIILLTDHNEFKNFNLLKVREKTRSNLIIDAKRLIEPENAVKNGFCYYGVGYGK